MADEKVFTIPLRDAYNEQRTKRSKVAINIVRDFLKRHMKSEKISIGDSINKEVWSRGIQKPPRRIRIHALKENDVVYAELLDVDIKTPSAEEVKEKEEKEKEKKEKIKEDRKERRKMTIQEELEAEEGKLIEEPEKEEKKEEPKPKEKKEEVKTESKEK